MQPQTLEQAQQVMLMLSSKKIKTRQLALRLGAEIVNPATVLMYNEELGSETYNKCCMFADGTWCHTTCPVGLLMGCDDWRIWHLGFDLYIGYDKNAKNVNIWWEKILTSALRCAEGVPQMFGDLVMFRHKAALDWNELEARREIINFLVTKYRKVDTYKFCY